MSNNDFIKILKALISGNNALIKKMFALKIVNHQGKPKLLVRTTNEPDELHILALQLNFVVQIEEEIQTLMYQQIPDEKTRNDFTPLFIKTIQTLQEQVSKKITKNKEKDNGIKIQQN